MAKKSKEFGERLKYLIEKSDMNVNQLSKKTAINPPLIWNYIKLGRIPEVPILYKLSKEFGVSMEALYTGEGIDHQNHDNLIDLNRRREDKDTELKANIELFIEYWQSGNPHVRELFEMGLKTAEKLLEKPSPSRRGKIEKKEM